MDKLEKEEMKLQKAKEKINALKNVAKERERKLRFEKANDIGKLAIKANIADVDTLALLGAFLEISQSIDKTNQIEEWQKSASQFLLQLETEERVAMIISCKSEPQKQLKDALKKLRLNWNPIRKEFFGYAFKKDVEALVDSDNFTIEIVPYE